MFRNRSRMEEMARDTRHGMEGMAREARHGMQRMSHDAREGMEGAAHHVRHGFDDMMTMAGDRGRQAIDAGEMMAHEASRRIRDYPLATVFAAAALGLFTGFLLSRR
jgi:ElaB/YqjD/DUF883 family membrane-anchored ribosome-binding protein